MGFITLYATILPQVRQASAVWFEVPVAVPLASQPNDGAVARVHWRMPGAQLVLASSATHCPGYG
jgi:hypothetical protein